MANIKLSGRVSFNMVRTTGDTTEVNLSITPSDESLAELSKLVNDKIDNPIKTDEDGFVYIKSHSKYPVSIYENAVAVEEEDGIKVSDIGYGSEVEIIVNLKDGKYKGKPYQSAYLKAVNVLNLVLAEDYNPFA